MSSSTHPSKRHLSVSGIAPDVIAKRLASLPIVKIAPVSEDSGIVLVELEEDGIDARSVLPQIRKLLTDEARAEVTLEDDYGNELYPTGNIQVRFTDVPSDEDLDALGAALGLKPIARNEFQPKQVSFESTDKIAGDLTSDIGRLEELPEVQKVWPEVMARYRRYRTE